MSKSKSDILKDIIDILENEYDKNTSFLSFEKDYELVIAVLLSPRSKDAEVQKVCEILFFKYKTLKELENASLQDIENIIRSVGFYHQKAKIVKDVAKIFQNGIPSSMQELLKIKGMGRKCASVVMLKIFNQPAVIVDTHFSRVANRIGIIEKNPTKLEFKIKELLPSDIWGSVSVLLNVLGREVCKKNPNCQKCKIAHLCEKNFNL